MESLYNPGVMKRTQMYFDEGDWARIQARAKASDRSAASVVREAVTAYFGDEPSATAPRAADLLGIVKTSKIPWDRARRQAWEARAKRIVRSSATRTSSSGS